MDAAATLLRSLSVNNLLEHGALLALQLHAIFFPAGDLHGPHSLRARSAGIVSRKLSNRRSPAQASGISVRTGCLIFVGGSMLRVLRNASLEQGRISAISILT